MENDPPIIPNVTAHSTHLLITHLSRYMQHIITCVNYLSAVSKLLYICIYIYIYIYLRILQFTPGFSSGNPSKETHHDPDPRARLPLNRNANEQQRKRRFRTKLSSMRLGAIGPIAGVRELLRSSGGSGFAGNQSWRQPVSRREWKGEKERISRIERVPYARS